MAPVDPHSYTDGDHPLTTDIALDVKLDFTAKKVYGTAKLMLASKASGVLDLDTRGLTIERAVDSQGQAVAYELLEPADPIKGTCLRLLLHDQEVSITYSTSESATALQWLVPEQTAGGRQPYVFTQCQAIHARSVFPCQDTPVARIRYTATVEVPPNIRVVMSARLASHVEKDGCWVDMFDMRNPIPPYLFAFAAGDIVSEEITPRCSIYAEPSVLKAAVYEFADMDKMVATAESLFGPYEWTAFNVLVMPPSFPYGGMENPRMTFLTPTVVTGDRSNVTVVAHELAHSWTGNIVSNATMNDFWLNEGWTRYAEWRIKEALEGSESAELHAAIGWNRLMDALPLFEPRFSRLKTDQEGIDPDEVFSDIPYEKGFLFVRRLEQEVGRPTFDKFIKKYIATFRFQSITTETFLTFLLQEFPDIGKTVDLDKWIHGEGLPEDAPRARSERLTRVQELAGAYLEGRSLTKEDYADWKAAEWQIYLGSLPKTMPEERVAALEKDFSLSTSPNWELRIDFLAIGAHSAYTPCFPAIEKALLEVGRMKFLQPLYRGLVVGGNKALGREIFEKAKMKYHIIARQGIEGILSP
eukprot:TRINITY_DN472_c0_g1_i1.p1 TRINITY_DN472_c0_g1~~TRINITY_DN472_c0_g1_i1.p1  ORF type:complete len:585 (+),score=74.15 TRINITY_DN472_c0_g1_i1:320-2074(+)